MKTEKIVSSSSNRCLNVVANRVESLRINKSTENTVRVYDNGMIGVAGALGSADWDELQRQATANLAQNIPYPETHDAPLQIDIDATKDILPGEQLVGISQRLLDRLAKENPEFLFSNKIFLTGSEESYSNSDGTDLHYKGNSYTIALAIKYRGSANIMDEIYSNESDRFDEDAICHDVKLKCDAFLKQLPHVEEQEVVCIGNFEPLQYAIEHLIADMYYNNASLLSGKLGQKVFDERLNIAVDRDPQHNLELPFFDKEGVVNKDYVNYIVKNGVLTHLLTCKRSVAQYGAENLGAASATYNGVPNIGIGGFDVYNTADDLSQLVHGKAVYLSMTGGGDMTPDGEISMPTMVAYLYEDGKLLGKLPEFAVTVNMFDLLNDGFVGVCEHGLFRFGKTKYFVYKAKLVNKA